MALNTTIFSGSGSADDVANQTAATVPEYLSYILLCIVLMSIPVVIVPALWAIVIIVKNKKLQTNNNTFLINLLIADVGLAAAVVLCCNSGLLTVLYLLGVNVDVDCRIAVISVMIFVIGSRMMFIPTCVDRFIHIAFPFSYKWIITTKAIMAAIITLWMITIVITIFIFINEPYEYIPSIGSCHLIRTNIPLLLIYLLCNSVPIVVITITSIYLRHRIIKSKNFFHSVKRNAAQERKSNKVGRLAEILQEQVKPTMAVFRVGRIDAVLDIISAVISSVAILVASPSNPVVFIVSGLLI